MTTTQPLKPPVLIIGWQRSGTSMLVRLLGNAPGMVDWYEPNTLWRIGHAYRDHDRATPEDARPAVRRRIRKAMLSYQRAHGDRRVVEKSPFNAARIGFVHQIFPESKIIHLHRDGRGVLASQLNRIREFQPFDLTSASGLAYLRRRLSITPWWEWPAYLPRFAHSVWRRYVARRPRSWFGLRYEGWREDRGRADDVTIGCKHWDHAMRYAMDDLASIPTESWMDVPYEALVTDPIAWFTRICSFCEIELTDEYLQRVREQVHPRSVGIWKDQLDAKTLSIAQQIMGETTERRAAWMARYSSAPG